MHNKILFVITAVVMLFTGCSLAPEMKTPKLELPVSENNTTIESSWWKNFNDENLNILVDEALKNSDDLKLAITNVQKARAQYGISESDIYPHLDMDASASREKKSSNGFPSNLGGIYNSYGISASASYELDFWGKVRNQKNADYSSLLANDANKEALRITLIVDVATYYFNLVSINQQLNIAQDSLKSYKEILAYKKTQLKHGVVDELVVAQATAQVASANTSVQTIKISKIKTQSALALLLGRTPKEIFERNIVFSKKLPNSIEIPSTLPANLLQNRPDIKEAEENLRAKTALIGVAKAAYFPTISLTGSYGYQSQNFSNLINKSSSVWGFGPSLNMPIFDFGKISSSVEASEAEQKAALINYDKTVKTAYKEVYDSLGTITLSKLKRDSAMQELAAYNQAYTLASKKFEHGTVSYLDVLVTQEGLLKSKLSSVTIKTQLLVDELTLYKVLGGGWKR